jgi:cyclic-di-AMP phosphodiesterase PgpH
VEHLVMLRREKPISFLSIVLGFLSVLFIFIFGHRNGSSLSMVLKFSILSVVLLTLIMFYLVMQQDKIYKQRHFTLIFGTLYLGSLIGILFVFHKPAVTIWMMGGLLIAMFFNMYLGYMVTLALVVFASFAGGYDLEFIVYLLILGTLICLLSGYMKQYSTFFYSAVIILSIQIILLFVTNNFILAKSLNITAVYSLVSTLVTLLSSFFIYTVYRIRKEKSEKEQAGNKSAAYNVCFFDADSAKTGDFPVDTKNFNVLSAADELKLKEILDSDFPLLVRLKQHSEKVYKHSLYISELCERAAKAIGANELVAKAGGLYHEIGRISNKDYVEEGIKLAEEYHLPKVIMDIIRQHNIKYDRPKSPEAAVVMITISIIATKEYLEKAERNSAARGESVTPVSMKKIVENVFQMRLSKGSLDESGLTLKQYHNLKEFFLHLQLGKDKK